MLDISDQYVKIKLSNVEDINKTAASDLINLNMFHSKLGRSRSNLGGWQADYTDLKNTWWLQSLDETIKNICLEIINYNNPRAKFNLQLNYWANINYFGDSNAPHSHTRAARTDKIPQDEKMVIDTFPITPEVLSGVYYIKLPPNSGNFYLRNRRHSYLNNIFNNSFNEVIDINQDDLLLFWPDVEHGVDTNYNKDEARISLAFNAILLPHFTEEQITNGVQLLNKN